MQQTMVVTNISISAMPNKIEYAVGESLDLSGMVVKATFTNGSEEIITGWTSSPADGSVLYESGITNVEIRYQSVVCRFTVTVNNSSQNLDAPTDFDDPQGVKTASFFWGTWVRMDNGNEHEILETYVKQGSDSYKITVSDANSLSVETLGTFKKESDSVIVCDNIPYYRNGGTNLEYSLKLVGFTSQLSRAVGTGVQGIKGRAASSKYKTFESKAESDNDGRITFVAPTANDTQTVTINYNDETIVIPELTVSNTGDYMGTVALVGKDEYNLKITGTISNDQKDNGYLYGNNIKTYPMDLTITNISKVKCSTSVCVVESDDANLNIRAADNDTDLTGLTISTLTSGATKTIKLWVSFGKLDEPYVDTGINVTITNPLTRQEWKDYIPLRFFKGTIPITIAAKNPENNYNAALNGFVIYPDGNNQFFAIPNNSCKPIFVPTFGTGKPYMLVFSGATVTSQLSDSTEMYYTVEPASMNLRQVITSGKETLQYIPFGGNNHSESTAYLVTEGFEAYLTEGEIDYYKIIADSDITYSPGGSAFYSVSFESERGDIPNTFLAVKGSSLNEDQLPELTCDDYEFLGWYSGNEKITAGRYSVYNNLTLTARWVKKCIITYSSAHGTTPTVFTAESGTAITSANLPTLTESGWIFEGWYTDSIYTQSITPGYVLNNSITLYAKWSEYFGWTAVSNGSYRFNQNGNSWISNNNGINSSSATTTWEVEFTSPIRYTISYSVSSESRYDKLTIVLDGTTIVNGISGYTSSSYTAVLQEGLHVLTATYSKDSSGHGGNDQAILTLPTVDYEAQGVCELSYSTSCGNRPQSVSFCRSKTLWSDSLPQLSESGYVFKGWFIGDEKVTEGTVITASTTLTAKWELETYRITYVTNGGKKNTNNRTSYTIEDEIELYAPTYTGHTFAGWFSDEGFTHKVTKITAGTTGNITLYARWGEEGKITISLPEYNDISVNYVRNGNYITFTGPEGFTSYEWQVDSSKMQTSDNTITINVSRWSRGRHVIILVAKNGSTAYNREATVYLNIE